MPLLRKLTVLAGAAEAARRYARRHPDKVNNMVEKVGRFVDKRTNGRFRGKIKGVTRKARITGSSR